jgi:hypothetical protein
MHWTYLPSVVSAGQAFQNAVVKYNSEVPSNQTLNYVPTTSIAVPAWSVFDLTGNWNLNRILQIRGGINNVFGVGPPITAATSGYPPGTNLGAVCAANAPGCRNPVAYSLPSDGAGFTNAGWYAEGVYGRTFFLGVKASF